MTRLHREPLFHFFLLGALLFGLYSWLNRDAFTAPNEIIVSHGQLQSLQAQFERVWQRPPTSGELQGLIDAWVREEILYREGLAMGLDRDDPVVRRRIGQKLEFIMEAASPPASTRQDLQAWLDQHPASYAIEPKYSIRQIYFDPARHGERLQSRIETARHALERGQAVRGDLTLLPALIESAQASEVARTFGGEFARALETLPIGSWQGPVQSGLGLHLVSVVARQEGRKATLDEVRDAVERDLMHAQAQQMNEVFYKRLRSNYAVQIERTSDSVADPTG